MPAPVPHDVRLELSDPRELFEPPELDPLAGQPHGDSGIERILTRIRPKPHRPVHTTLRLPASTRAPDLEARLRAGLQRHCDVRIGQLTHDLASLRQEGLATLWRGVLFLAMCMLGSRILGDPKYVTSIVARFLDEGLVIAGWVALWYPLDALLYQHWPLKRERRLYESLRTMDLELEFVDGSA